MYFGDCQSRWIAARCTGCGFAARVWMPVWPVPAGYRLDCGYCGCEALGEPFPAATGTDEGVEPDLIVEDIPMADEFEGYDDPQAADDLFDAWGDGFLNGGVAARNNRLLASAEAAKRAEFCRGWVSGASLASYVWLSLIWLAVIVLGVVVVLGR